jgi:hypothetical protein
VSQFGSNPQQFGAYQPQQQPPRGAVQSNGKAVASLVLGILSFIFTILAGIPAIILGTLALRDASRSRGRVGGQGLAIAGIVLGSLGSLLLLVHVALLVPAITGAREAAYDSKHRAESSNKLKQIGMALHNHHDRHRNFPAASIVDESGKPLLSWRVAILPFIGQQGLYSQFNLDEPWDSNHNKQLIAQMPDVYRTPGAEIGTSKTLYLAVVGQELPMQQTAFRNDGKGIRFAQFTDGTSNTILVVEANENQAVEWTKPDDWNFDPRSPRRGLGEFRRAGFLALFADGSIHLISDSVTDETVGYLFCRMDGKRVEF